MFEITETKQKLISTSELSGKSSIIIYGEGGRELVRITEGSVMYPPNNSMEDMRQAIRIMLEHLESKK